MSFDIRTWPLLTEHQASNSSCEPYGHTIRNMQRFKFYTCGFVIYRCTYGNDDLWSRLIEWIQTETLECLEDRGRAELLGPLIPWTVIEDRETLEDATVKQVQERFLKWSVDVSDERDGPGAVNAALLFPRYNFCTVIDQKCLDSFAAHEKEAAAAAAAGQKLFVGDNPPVFVIFIRIKRPVPAWVAEETAAGEAVARLTYTTLADGQTDDTAVDQVLDGEDVDEEVIENEDVDEDWMYVRTYLLMSMYENCRDPSSYWNYYVRPPKIYPRGEAN